VKTGKYSSAQLQYRTS